MQQERIFQREGISQWTKMISPEVISFLKAAVLMFFTWKILYALVLQPSEIPDAWLVRSVASSTALVLNLTESQDRFSVVHARRRHEKDHDRWETHSVLFRNGDRKVLGIYPPCNGLELMVLAAGFIICFQGSVRRKVLYVVYALAGVFILNVIRCWLLTKIGLYYPMHFDFVHKYLFNIAAYAFIFLLWVSYVPKPSAPFVLENEAGAS